MHRTSWPRPTAASLICVLVLLWQLPCHALAAEIDPAHPPENMEVQVAGRTAGETWTLQLYRRTTRTKDFTLWLWDKSSGYVKQSIAPPVRTYRGMVKELPNALVVAGLAPDGELYLLITEDGRTSLFFDGYYVNHTTRPLAKRTFQDPPPVPVVSGGDLRPGSPGTSSLGIGVTRGQAKNGVRYDQLVEAEYAMEIPYGVWLEHRGKPLPIDSVLTLYEFIMLQHDMVLTRDAGIRIVLPQVVIRQDPLNAALPHLEIVATEWKRKETPLAESRWDVVWHVRGDDHPRGYSMSGGWPKNSFACGPQLDHEAGHLWGGQHDPYGDSAMQYGHTYYDGMDWQIMESRRRHAIDQGELPPASERWTDPLHPRTCTDAVRLKRDEQTDIDVLANDWSSNGSRLTITSCKASKGQAVVTAQGTIHYIPPPGYVGKDVIVYTVQDDSPMHLSVSELVHIDLMNGGLMVHYPFTDISGTTVTDATGNGLNGVLSHSDCAHDWVAAPTGRGLRIWGKSNEARHFYNGLICADQGNLLPCPLATVPLDESGNRHSNALDAQDGDFSLAMWFRADSFAVGPCLAKKSADTDDLFSMRLGWFLRAEPDHLRLWCTFWGPRSAEDPRDGAPRAVLNQVIPVTWQTNHWYHVAMVIDRHTNETRLYLDGHRVSAVAPAFIPGSKLFHGRVPVRVATNSKGSICVADVRIYASALNDDNVAALHGAGGADARLLGTDTSITVNAGIPLSSSQGNDSLATYFNEGAHAPITYSKLSGPEWLTVSSLGRLAGTPPPSAMTQPLRIRLTDRNNRAIEQLFSIVTRNGGLISEFWLNNNPVHPLLIKEPRTPPYSLGFSPDRIDFLTQAEMPSRRGNSYFNNLYAWLIPPTSGDYRFWIAADDNAVLELSSDAKPYRARVVARSQTVTPHQWDAQPEQASALIPLIAGQKYYLEARMQQTTGQDHLAIAWQGPGIDQQIIPGSALMFYRDLTAGVTLDLWADPPGDAAAAAFTKDVFPTTTQSLLLPSFFTKGRGNSYLARFRALLIPEITGTYTLWIASGDRSELRFSTDDKPGNKSLIASVPGYSEINRWDKFASMKSKTVELIAGRRYYMEAIMLQGGGDFDNLSVAWLPPGGVRAVIPGRNLECIP